MDNLISLKALFTERVFKIPDYQRGYAWTDKERQDLLDDLQEIESLRKRSEYEHFTGTVVLEDTGPHVNPIPGVQLKTTEVVDGQQRLLTLIVLLTEIINCYRGLVNPTWNQAADRLSQDYVKLTPNGPYLVELNDPDVNRFFKDAILEATVSGVRSLLQKRMCEMPSFSSQNTSPERNAD